MRPRVEPIRRYAAMAIVMASSCDFAGLLIEWEFIALRRCHGILSWTALRFPSLATVSRTHVSEPAVLGCGALWGGGLIDHFVEPGH
jgi:hypothetical protein